MAIEFDKKLENSHVNRELGFSLLEMLIALAIMSLTSLALFQSIGTMLNVSDRAVSASERTLEGTIARKAVSELIDGLVADWSDQAEHSFSGKRLSFSGVSANAIHSSKSENAPFTLSLQGGDQAAQSLLYEINTESWALETGLPPGGYFEYLGRQNLWHRQWPPTQTPALDTQDALSQLTILRLPLAIRVSSREGLQMYIYSLGQHQPLPDRMDILRDQ